jgi:hypothetical protein
MFTIKAAPAQGIAASALVGLVIANVLGAAPAQADPIDNGTQLCAYDRPCITDVHDLVNDGIWVEWDPNGSFDKFHFSWAHKGGPWHPNEFTGRTHFVIRPAWKNTEYVFSLQGCESVLIGKDNCSPFEETSFTTNNI